MSQTRYSSKSWVFKIRFSLKVRQYRKQQFYLQYKVCWILNKMVGATSFSTRYLRIQPLLPSPPKIRFSTSVNFHLPIAPLPVFKIIILTITSNTPFLFLPQQFFTSRFLRTILATIRTKNILPTSPFRQFKLR